MKRMKQVPGKQRHILNEVFEVTSTGRSKMDEMKGNDLDGVEVFVGGPLFRLNKRLYFAYINKIRAKRPHRLPDSTSALRAIISSYRSSTKTSCNSL